MIKHVSAGLAAAALLGLSAIPAAAQGVSPASGLSLQKAVLSSGQGGSDSNSGSTGSKTNVKHHFPVLVLGLAALAGGIAAAASSGSSSNGSPASP